jgi:phenylacetate-CoA ligase
MPILEEIDGRMEDICVTRDGRQMLRFDTVFKGVSHIRQAQVVQEQIDAFSVNIVAADGFGVDDVKAVQRNMRRHVGGVDVSVRRVDTIPRSASGKFRAVVCNLSKEEKRRFGLAAVVPRVDSGGRLK